MKFLLILLTTFSVFTINYSYASEWQLIKNKSDIKVYSRFPEDSDFKEIKIESVVESDLSALVALLTDVPNYPNWIYACNNSKLIKKVSDTEEYYYAQTDAPWPFSNRDVVMHSVMTQDNATKILKFNSYGTPSMYPLVDEVVRVKDISVSWKLIPISDNKIKIQYHLKADPGGFIPSWLANLTVDIGPYNTMINMRDELKKEKYQNVNFDFVID